MRRLVKAMHVVYENGGVLIEERLLLTQNLNWLSELDNNPYVNKRNVDF